MMLHHIIGQDQKCVYCGMSRSDVYNSNELSECPERRRLMPDKKQHTPAEYHAMAYNDPPKADNLIGEALRRRDPWDVPKKN